jgi:dihydroflavonol-4-reductase
MVRVLVTGGSGFIGRHLVAELLAIGDDVRVLDLDSPMRGDPAVEYVQGSVADRAACEKALDDVERVYHLAGIAHLWQRQREDFDIANRRGTEVMLKAAADKRVRRFVHCSTESILLPRRRNHRAIDESKPPALDDMAGPYTRSKHLAETAALKAAKGGLDVVVVNPTVPIGLGDRNMTPPAAMLALFLSGHTPFFLDCILNLVDVRDIADGIVRAGESGRPGERYILGGENVALKELLPILERKSGHPMPKRRVPGAVALMTGSVSGWIADRVTHRPPVVTREAVILALRSAPFDSAKAKRELGYHPGPIDRPLTEVVEAFKRERSNLAVAAKAV